MCIATDLVHGFVREIEVGGNHLCSSFKGVFQGVSSEELRQVEAVLKKIGKRAESLAETRGHLQLSESSGIQV